MDAAHASILLGGLLGVLCILIGVLSRRFGLPVLLVFLGLGMLAGEDGVLGIPFDDFHVAYLIGSIALAVILLEGGLQVEVPMLREAFWPALVLATVGVVVTAGCVGLGVAWLSGLPIEASLLIGAVVAPTDAAAVNALLGRAGIMLPARVTALLELESGMNDPMSVFLTLLGIGFIAAPGTATPASAALLFIQQMAGGVIAGAACGALLAWLLRRLKLEPALLPILVLTFGLSLFGAAQMFETSGFLAVYIAAAIAGWEARRSGLDLITVMSGLAWLAQIVLFLMLGLLVTPHTLPPYVVPAIIGAAALILVARPVAVFACLLPFRFSVRESAFASWVGLRGAVPIYLSVIPALADPNRDIRLFGVIFIVVVASLIVQGWTVAPVARLLGYGRRAAAGVE